MQAMIRFGDAGDFQQVVGQSEKEPPPAAMTPRLPVGVRSVPILADQLQGS